MAIWYKVSLQDKSIQSFPVDEVNVRNDGYPLFEPKEWVTYRYINYLQEEKLKCEKRYSTVHIWCPDIASAKKEVLRIVDEKMKEGISVYEAAFKQAMEWEKVISCWGDM